MDDDSVFVGSVGVRGYIVDHRPGFFAVDRRSGKPRWSFLPDPGDSEFSGFTSSPAVDDARVYVGGLDRHVYAFEKVMPGRLAVESN